jgi:hypothetical protein
MPQAKTKEWPEKALTGGALMLAIPAILLLMVGHLLIYRTTKFTLRISVEFTEPSSDELNKG